MSNKNSIWFIANIDFPEGRGGTPRVRNLAEGFSALQFEVKVFIPHAAGYVSTSQNKACKGNVASVYFEYLTGSTGRPQSEIKVSFAKLFGNINLLFKYLFLSKPRFIIFYSHSLLDTGLIIFAAKIFGTKIIYDVCDERFDVHAHGWEKSILRKINSFHAKISDKILFKIADAFLCVSTYLKQKIETLSRGQPILMVPLVSGQFPEIIENENKTNERDFAYIGSIIPDEGIEILLDALKLVNVKYPDSKCTIYGDANNHSYLNVVKQLIKEFQLQNNIIIAGSVNYKELMTLLPKHHAYVLPRPNSVISRAGFPGKLFEYLSSARPIVTTPFGDILLYFKNEINAYVCKDFTAKEFADKMIKSIEYNSESDRIGYEGYKTGKNLFELQSVVQKIIIFVNSV